jgi:hypothetical protein
VYILVGIAGVVLAATSFGSERHPATTRHATPR